MISGRFVLLAIWGTHSSFGIAQRRTRNRHHPLAVLRSHSPRTSPAICPSLRKYPYYRITCPLCVVTSTRARQEHAGIVMRKGMWQVQPRTHTPYPRTASNEQSAGSGQGAVRYGVSATGTSITENENHAESWSASACAHTKFSPSPI